MPKMRQSRWRLSGAGSSFPLLLTLCEDPPDIWPPKIGAADCDMDAGAHGVHIRHRGFEAPRVLGQTGRATFDPASPRLTPQLAVATPSFLGHAARRSLALSRTPSFVTS